LSKSVIVTQSGNYLSISATGEASIAGNVGVTTLPSLPSGVNDIGQTLNGLSEVSVLTSASRTASGNTASIDVSKYKEAIVFLDVTAVSGTTPTLDVKFQVQDPVSLKWFDVAELTFTQATVVTSQMKSKANLIGSNLRCVYTIGGAAPSFTFSVGLIVKS
jgi:hypothetical protein